MATQTVTAPLTSDEFLERYSEVEDGFRRFELFDGEVVTRPMPNEAHDVIKNLIGKCLDRYLEKHPGFMALIEITFWLERGVVFTPDIAVISSDRVGRSKGFATGSPDIAFEVISSDSARRLQFKIDAYLEHGSKAVCCIYPEHQRISVFMPGQWIEFRNSDVLEFPSVLPGFAMPVQAIFKTP